MVETSAPSNAPSRPPEPRYLVLLVVTILGATLGALFVAVAVGALLWFLPSVVGFAIGLVLFGLGLPLFLALRAAAALKRRGRGPLLRRLVVIALIAATQLAIFGVILQYTARTTGHLAMTAYEVLEVVGPVPVLSSLLYAHAERHDVKPRKDEGPPTGPDGGVLTADGGPAVADGGSAGADAGATKLVVDAGAAGDAGTAAPPGTATARLPAPPKPKPGIPLSARAAGKPVRIFCAGVQTNEGDDLLVVGTIAAGGAFTARTVELGAHAQLGAVTLVECADDGAVAAIVGGAHLVVARPGKTTAELVKGLAPGNKLAGLEVQAVRDVVIGPGGHGLAVIDLLGGGEGGEVKQALVALPRGPQLPLVLRKAGDKVPGSESEATIAKSWSFKKSSGAGSVLVTETYLEGGDDLATRLSGETWVVNPQRLLVVKLAAPKALVEIARTGLEPSGIAGFELQIFGDAWLLPDGRALFDANFLEQGSDGWLFLHKPGAGVFAVAPEKHDMSDGPWTARPPRVRSLEASADGVFVFRRDDGAAVLASLDRPTEATAALLGADALAADGKKLGTVLAVDVPLLARGGEWLIASVQLAGSAGGATHDAVVLASRADVQNGKAQVLLEVGGPLPAALTSASPRQIQSLRFFEGRDELLWTR